MTTNESLTQSVASLSGIGAQSVIRLQKLGIETLQDLIFHLPHRYEDRTRIYPINTITAGMTVLICGTVDFTDILMTGRNSLLCRISDNTAYITLRFFHFNAKQLSNLSPGTLISCFGEIRHGYQGLEIIHPEYKIISSTNNITENCLSPIYPLTEGLRQASLRKAIKQSLSICLEQQQSLPDYLPEFILSKYQYPSLRVALQTLHSPEQQITAEQLQQGDCSALKRLAFEELLAHHLMLINNKVAYKKWQAPVFATNKTQRQEFTASLPFKLTKAQQRIVDEITFDCNSHHPMLRLVQGDVGSGKTVVSAYAVLLAINAGYQVALMAPTELLAEQHHRSFKQWFKNIQSHIVYLTGRLKGQHRKDSLEAIEDGSAKLVIGTHALFQNSVHFKNLGLIIIDEQHRFGVHQRLALREKGQTKKQRPHQLIMTATPIPRTLAMLNYSDLDISIIDELPPGRKPVTTSVVPSQRRQQIIAKINQWTANKHQTYWVCTLIEESEVLQCEAAEKTTEHLKHSLPNVRVALVHGKMKTAEKEAIMQAFKNHEYDLLVATTVIEVGVDVPNASLIIIENAERLGLSQLHQLRGRVGRGEQQSYCLLVYQRPLSDTGRERLGILRENNDGFVIAEKDLQLRGPGDVMGTRQTGQIQLKIADLNRDTDLLDKVQETAQLMISKYPSAIQPLIDRWLGHNSQYSEV
ncbi:MAG: ATP-dependent DNA helicase RecG [Methylococcales symbiont of Iophon sp. n. MRB-2018]|nr:MAG: ATP-dependent DNA helicase RecG [Methylococcales symbiont of Iophon sp. n. MRB-2018]KAF3980289.1 MAG: ATP-dependent DNA helicase RecG [Methylococcales symbiont of Iophon sp. n. MRB-2018]